MKRLADGTPVYEPSMVVPCDICAICGGVRECSVLVVRGKKRRVCEKCSETLDAGTEG